MDDWWSFLPISRTHFLVMIPITKSLPKFVLLFGHFIHGTLKLVFSCATIQPKADYIQCIGINFSQRMKFIWIFQIQACVVGPIYSDAVLMKLLSWWGQSIELFWFCLFVITPYSTHFNNCHKNFVSKKKCSFLSMHILTDIMILT